MDKVKEAANIIININKYRDGLIKDYELIKIVCSFFDKIKEENISEHDRKFLIYISNVIGVPHFYDLLSRFSVDTFIDNPDLSTLSAIIYENTLKVDSMSKIHKYQKEIINFFNKGGLNRFFLSASTSFGKTYLVFEIIKKMDYRNVVLIFPTIALLSENLEKLTSVQSYSFFVENYYIHTLSDVERVGDRNLYIYTPERFLSFIEKRNCYIEFDFVFVDEAYKIDNEYIIDNLSRENERDVAYRLAVYEALKNSTDVLLAGPYIDFFDDINSSFNRFLLDNSIELINYNDYEIVNKTFTKIDRPIEYKVDDDLVLRFNGIRKKKEMLIETIRSILVINQNSIIYCYSKSKVEEYANILIDSNILIDHSCARYSDFLDHVKSKFDKDWVVVRALECGIGIHHGLVPKYIQKEIVSLFNRNLLSVLISTTTITEGVNTSAKNLVVLHDKKGHKDLKKFDAKNIAGRAGRFLFHYSGRVIVLKNDFMTAINSGSDCIKHKNYDLNSPKDEIDLFMTKDEFLRDEDKGRRANIKQLQREKDIPDFVFSLYKVVNRLDKISIYDRIQVLTQQELKSINDLIIKIHSARISIDFDGFQVILNTIMPFVVNEKTKYLIEYKVRNSKYSVMVYLVYYYLRSGFEGSVEYKKKNGKEIDKAISETSYFIYNILKYHMVKYLGVFNIMYKLYKSKRNNQSFDTIIGLDKLLTKLEYNALTEKGRIASDFGVPSSIVDFYENYNNSSKVMPSFDSYESEVFSKIEKLFSMRNND